MRRTAGIAALFFLLALTSASAQTSSTSAAYGQVINALTAPTINSVTTTCSASTTWTYQITAVDAAGGSTLGSSPSSSVSTGCTSLSTANYNIITFTTPAGAVACNIYRVTSSPTTGRIAKVPCGTNLQQVYVDSNNGTLDSSSPPTVQGSGSISAAGSVIAQNFLRTSNKTSTLVGLDDKSNWMSDGCRRSRLTEE
jgi:hypothetical protein